MKLYMHLMQGHPAFYDGEQICIASKSIWLENMVADLTTIRSQQRKSMKFRAKNGWPDCIEDYGYIIVRENTEGYIPKPTHQTEKKEGNE